MPPAMGALTAWRTFGPDHLPRALAGELRVSLKNVVPVDFPDFDPALEGDSAAAIRIALKAERGGLSVETLDLRMAPVTALAIDGDVSARMTIGFVLGRRSAEIENGRALSQAWMSIAMARERRSG
jgi:hypothetical protein